MSVENCRVQSHTQTHYFFFSSNFFLSCNIAVWLLLLFLFFVVTRAEQLFFLKSLIMFYGGKVANDEVYKRYSARTDSQYCFLFVFSRRILLTAVLIGCWQPEKERWKEILQNQQHTFCRNNVDKTTETIRLY